MSLNKSESAASSDANNNALTVSDLSPTDPQHGAKVTSFETKKGKNGDFEIVHLELTSSELKGKTLNAPRDRFGNSEAIEVGSKVVCNLGTNRAGYPDIVGGRLKNYLVK